MEGLFLSSLFFVKTRSIRSIAVPIENSMISLRNGVLILKGEIVPPTPKINNKLKILEPIIFPITRSVLFFKLAEIEVTSSGSEVPSAMANREIIVFGIDNSSAKYTVDSMTHFPPSGNKIMPRVVNIRAFRKLILLSEGSSGVFS